MASWELLAYSTALRTDIRYRAYTRSRAVAEKFTKIPRINFTDSGHGIVFYAYEMRLGEQRKLTCGILREYVNKHMKGAPR